MTSTDVAPTTRAAGASLVLLTLASGQFLMTLDSSVMNVSIATVAKDVGTTVTGIQGAITAYTLVMASLMITGAKVGAIIGRKRAFAIGCVIYGCGSFITALAPSLPVLLFGWSFLEGVGAALILPAIVALVAGNFPVERRPAAYGLVAAAGAIAIAVGPLIGGFFTTYFSWRWVFAGEVVIVFGILLLVRRIADAPAEERPSLDIVGAALSALGLGMLVFGVLRSSEWGWIQPKAGGPSWAGLSPTVWLILGGLFVIWLFSRWQVRREARGEEPLVRPGMLRNRQLSGGLIMFFFQYLVQAGLFFVVPLFLSVVLGLTALETGVRLLPLSVTLLAAAIGIPRLLPDVSPRLVVRSGLLALLAGTVVLLAGLDADAGPEIVFVPMLLIGLGIGALASQLGAVTVSAVPDEESPEVGGVQNTMTNLGASLGTALAGSIMIAAVSASFLTNIEQSSAIPERVKSEAQVELAGGVPFISDADLEAALDEARVSRRTTEATLDAYRGARIDGLRSALAILAVLAIVALFFAQRIPTTQPGGAEVGPMCRWLAYSGSPIRLEELLVKRDRSLIDQSLHARQGATTTNGDGFGVGWYEDGETPRLYRSIHPAWNDRNLRELAAGITSPLFFSHIRASTGTAIQETNTHPFRYARWLWMHNGLIREFPRVRRELVLAVDESLYPSIEGTTDSETMFYLALTFGLEDDPIGAVERMVGFVEATGRKHGVEHPIQMTIATTDGRSVWAFRYSSEGDSRSLYFSTRMDALKSVYPESEELAGLSDETRAVVSEPLGDLPGAWNEVPESHVGVVQPGADELRPFTPRT